MERGRTPRGTNRLRQLSGLAASLLIFMVAACATAKASPTGTASSVPTGTASSAPTNAVASTAPVGPSPWDTRRAVPTLGPTEDPLADLPTDSPPPPLATGALPHVAAAPAGAWASITWIAVLGGHSPAVVPTGFDGSNVDLQSWSKGYIEFAWSPHMRTVTPWLSSNGLTWHSGASLDLSPWAPLFAEYDAELADPGSGDNYDECQLIPVNFQEAAGNLLYTADVECGVPGKCSSGPSTTTISWTSEDGASWRRETAVSDAEATISGGASGFVVRQEKDLLISADGQSWRHGALPARALATGSTAGDPASFAGGFVLPGVVLVKAGHMSGGPGGCGGDTEDLSRYEAALWWSPDGSTWTRDALSGPVSGYNGISATVIHLDDQTLIADIGVGDSDFYWGSRDGKSWTRLGDQVVDGVLGYRAHGLIATNDASAVNGQSLFELSPDMKVVPVKQTGDQLSDDCVMAIGPTGILATDDGSRFWIGVPSS